MDTSREFDTEKYKLHRELRQDKKVQGKFDVLIKNKAWEG